MGAEPEAGEALASAGAAGGAGKLCQWGQLDPRLAGGPRAGRPDADLDPRRRDEPAPDGTGVDLEAALAETEMRVVAKRLHGPVQEPVPDDGAAGPRGDLGRVPPPAELRRARSKPAATKPGQNHPWCKRITRTRRTRSSGGTAASLGPLPPGPKRSHDQPRAKVGASGAAPASHRGEDASPSHSCSRGVTSTGPSRGEGGSSGGTSGGCSSTTWTMVRADIDNSDARPSEQEDCPAARPCAEAVRGSRPPPPRRARSGPEDLEGGRSTARWRGSDGPFRQPAEGGNDTPGEDISIALYPRTFLLRYDTSAPTEG